MFGKRCFIVMLVLVLAAVFQVGGPDCAFSQTQVEFTSSPNPVGSGARALGMGGAFIGVADDATAASWNPGGLVQLKKPELSFVANGFQKTEDNTFGEHPEANKTEKFSEAEINYMSAVYPFNFLDRNMILSMNYQNLYDFTRDWAFPMAWSEDIGFGPIVTEADINYNQKGTLSAVGVAYCVQVVPQFSMGVTLNFWDDRISPNYWESNTEIHGVTRSQFPISSRFSTKIKDKYEFRGFNANVGTLWRATDKLSVGGVFKFPFTADLYHDNQSESHADGNLVTQSATSTEETMDMPWSTGLGVAYRFSDNLTMSADVYYTQWKDMVIKDASGQETSPITGKSADESDIDPTRQVRTGMEYLVIDPEKHYVIPIRAGLFYDPAPSEGEPDDYYGLSLGSGFAMDKYIFDVTYMYRFAHDVGDSTVQHNEFSQDVKDHSVYSSMIIHF